MIYHQVSGVLLVGGKSSRMGRDKALLRLNNQTLLDRALEKMLVLFDEVIVATNQPCKYNISGIKEVTDIYPGRGPLGGIHAGLKAAKFEQVFVVACDIPFWEPHLVRSLLEACNGFDAAVPRKGPYLEPLFAVYTKACLPAVENCLERNISKVTELYPLVRTNYLEEELLKTVSTPETLFFNINTPEDFYAISNQGQKRDLPLEQAQELLLQHAVARTGDLLPLPEALGRVIRENLPAPVDVLGFNRSLVDGYALCSPDTEKAGEKAPVRLQVLGEVAAGRNPHYQVSAGTAVKVMTGAPLPPGANAVVKYEEVRPEGTDVLVFNHIWAGTNVAQAGEEVSAGEIVAAKGLLVTPSLLGLLAAAGFNAIPVYSAVRAAIINTGSELAELGQVLGAGQIYNSNQYLLTALLRNMGVEPVPLGIVPDEAAKIAFLVQAALERADLVITTGGVSVGDYDLVEHALAMAGVRILFSGIAVRPGKSFVAGEKDGKLILGLSGHPGAAYTSFEFLVKPVLKKMMGYKDLLPRKVKVCLSSPYQKTDVRRMKAARLSIEGGTARAEILSWQGVMRNMTDCNLFVDIPPGRGTLTAGEKVSAYLVEKIDM